MLVRDCPQQGHCGQDVHDTLNSDFDIGKGTKCLVNLLLDHNINKSPLVKFNLHLKHVETNRKSTKSTAKTNHVKKVVNAEKPLEEMLAEEPVFEEVAQKTYHKFKKSVEAKKPTTQKNNKVVSLESSLTYRSSTTLASAAFLLSYNRNNTENVKSLRMRGAIGQ